MGGTAGSGMGGHVAMVLWPAHQWLTRRVRGRSALAAGLLPDPPAPLVLIAKGFSFAILS